MVREFWRVDSDSWMRKDRRWEAEAATDARMGSLHRPGSSPPLSGRMDVVAPRRGPGHHSVLRVVGGGTAQALLLGFSSVGH